MKKKFTLDDIENFLEYKLNMEWVNRLVFDYGLERYKKALLSDFSGDVNMLKIRKKNKEKFVDMLIDEDNFVLFKKGPFPHQKNLSAEWKKFRNFQLEI